ncbi:hypothetical protein SAMN05421879_10516 [Ornithinimicrobium cerasi]|uniref:Uncharacterized protein n=1 Tax=Ornithinimicrobium cerasi TaxID=2248773 RepID=A0A285VMJ1_9MICO|nr:hypothetical protein SAMN05421879_10516 [Ornithinimicrobium cerasi]
MVKSNDKKHGRIYAMRAFLDQFDYEGRDDARGPRAGPRRLFPRAKNTEDD